jgi:hypothetical protein
MKKGKTSKISGFKNSKITYGTVDSFELKSLYLNIQTWVEPTKESDNWNRVVLNLSRAIALSAKSMSISINELPLIPLITMASF